MKRCTWVWNTNNIFQVLLPNFYELVIVLNQIVASTTAYLHRIFKIEKLDEL